MHYLSHLNIGLGKEDYLLISKSNLVSKNDASIMSTKDQDKVNGSKSTIDESIYSDDN